MGFGNAAEFAIVMKLVDEVTGGLNDISGNMQGFGSKMKNTGNVLIGRRPLLSYQQ